jgi:hypothetical protein
MLAIGTPGVPLELWQTREWISFAEPPEANDFAGLAFVYFAVAFAGVMVAATVFNSATRASIDF